MPRTMLGSEDMRDTAHIPKIQKHISFNSALAAMCVHETQHNVKSDQQKNNFF